MSPHSTLESLILKQPAHLTPLQKFMRIDKLSCYEMEGEIGVNPRRSVMWFNTLCVALDYLYSCYYPEVLNFPPFHKSIMYAGYMSDEDRFDALPPREASTLVTQYIQTRREVVEYLEEECDVLCAASN